MIALLSANFCCVWGQSASQVAFNTYLNDSIFGYTEFLNMVAGYHPLARIADIEVDLADRNYQMSRGGFDPLLFGNYDTKEFSDALYYEKLEAGVELPTWLGLRLNAGIQDNSGELLNPEFVVPPGGQLYAGVSAQLGAGLLMDSRRAAFRLGQLGQKQGTVSRIILRNALFLDATAVYFSWALNNQSLQVANEALSLAVIRYEGLRDSYFQGDVPAIDTVEAYTQVLNRLYALREAQNRWVTSVKVVSAFIWDEEGKQVTLPAGVAPDRLGLAYDLDLFMPQFIAENHPELEKLRLKSQEFDIERRLAQEFLRPKIELKYNILSESVIETVDDEYFRETQFFRDNYTFGAKLSIPVPMREARGKTGMLRVKQQAVGLEFENKKALLIAELDAALIRRNNLIEQITFYTQNVSLLDRVLDGERELFSMGESSLFLINAREINLVQAQNLLFELQARERILIAEIMVTGGLGFP
jgi:outer membrane protein TolC